MYDFDHGIHYREVAEDESVLVGEDKFKVQVNKHYVDEVEKEILWFALPHDNNSLIYHLVNHWNFWPTYQYHVIGKV